MAAAHRDCELLSLTLPAALNSLTISGAVCSEQQCCCGSNYVRFKKRQKAIIPKRALAAVLRIDHSKRQIWPSVVGASVRIVIVKHKYIQHIRLMGYVNRCDHARIHTNALSVNMT